MLVLLLPLLFGAALASDSYYVHLALSSDPTKAYVQWRTDDVASPALVHYGATQGELTNTANGTSWTFTDSRTYNLRMATLSGLTPGAKVFYAVGDNATVLSFTATRARAQFSEDAPLKIAWFGDLGWQNAQALPYLVQEAAAGAFDHFIHVGDYAYDLPTNNGLVGDSFQAQIEPITNSYPYMGCEGNHEGGGEFAQYTNRFALFAGDNSSGATSISGVPSTPWNNHFYSYNIGLVHIVAVSTEAYFSYAGAAPQYAWLEADLAAVDRAVTPWVIVYGHRSIYCSCDGDCDGAATTVRMGPRGNGQLGMEAMFKRHAVDLWINGHEHDYERNYAVYNGALATGPSSGKPGGTAAAPEVLVNPTAPVYIVEGCAGDVEHHEPFTRPQPAYSAFRSNTYGYGRMTVYNASVLLWEQRQTDDEYPSTTGTVIDAMLLVKQA